MNIVIAGASGLVGSALVPQLPAAGHAVRRLVRRPIANETEIEWRPDEGKLDAEALEGIDAVINLAGENLAAGRWTAARKERILRSRVDATRTLAVAIGKMRRKPRVFLNASAAGFYGDRGDEKVTERSKLGQGFLPGVCLAWETHAEGAARQGVRTVLLRFGVILGRNGGALAKMLPVFRLRLGGPLGDGRQWMSWVALDDVVGAILHAMANERVQGPVNVVAPEPVTNAEFSQALGRVLGRPARLKAPAWALYLLFGEMANEALLASTRAEPRKLQETGYRFHQPELEPALRSILLGA
jgi:uncharacterized protein (TIGR01777 family)